jgi:hypothetical protein
VSLGVVRWHADGGACPRHPRCSMMASALTGRMLRPGMGSLPPRWLCCTCWPKRPPRPEKTRACSCRAGSVRCPHRQLAVSWRRSQRAHFAETKLGHFSHLANGRCKAAPISRSRPSHPLSLPAPRLCFPVRPSNIYRAAHDLPVTIGDCRRGQGTRVPACSPHGFPVPGARDYRSSCDCLSAAWRIRSMSVAEGVTMPEA